MEFLRQQILRYVAVSIYYYYYYFDGIDEKKERFFMSTLNSRDKTTQYWWSWLVVEAVAIVISAHMITDNLLKIRFRFVCAILHTLRMENVSYFSRFSLYFYFLCVICSRGTHRNTKCVFYFNDRIIFTYTINRLISSMTQPFSSYCVFSSSHVRANVYALFFSHECVCVSHTRFMIWFRYTPKVPGRLWGSLDAHTLARELKSV